MKKILIIAVVILCLGLLFLLPKLTQAQAQNTPYVPGEIIIKLKSSQISISSDKKNFRAQSSFSLNNLNKKYKVQSIDKAIKNLNQSKDKVGLSRIYKIKLGSNQSVLEAVQEYKQKPEVEWAEPNYIVKAALVPNDTYYASRQGNLTKISAPQGWDITTGSASVTIAIIDTGVDYNHNDLSTNIWPSRGYRFVEDYVSNPGDPPAEWIYVPYTTDPNYPIDDNGHGTHCAGIASAVTNNATGIAGVSWSSKIMAVKVLDNTGSGSDADCASGIDYAASNRANVISMSWGGYSDAELISDAVANAYASGCVLVGAAGNNNVQTQFYPAAYTNVLAVASTDSADHKSSFSNYGGWVDVSAPGENIYSTLPTGIYPTGYGYGSGTSMACPHVSGLAALIKAQYPSLINAQIVNQIKSKADNIDSLNPSYAGKLGTGRINVYKSLGGVTLTYTSQFSNQSAYPTLNPGQQATVWLDYKNKGNTAWYNSATADHPRVNLATSHPINRRSAFGSTWGGDQNRPGTFHQRRNGDATLSDANVINPGETAHFQFVLKAPVSIAPATYHEYFQPIVEGGTTMNDPWTFLDVTVSL